MNLNSPKPLEGIKVVDLSTYVAAPVCARMLADMGAEVVKIETFRGDPWRDTSKSSTFTDDFENPMFDIYNAGKKSICLNIKHELGMKTLLDMLANADIFITNTRPQSLKKLGLDFDTLHEKFPKLIYATITGYGDKGPDCDAPGFDNVAFWTRSGFLMDMSVRSEKSYPVMSPTGSGDTVAGAMLYGGVMTALYKRAMTGEGEFVTTALYNTGIWMLASMIMQAQEKYNIKFPKERVDCSPFSSPFCCADGEWVCITVLDYLRYRDTMFRILDIEEEMSKLDVSSYKALTQQSDIVIPIMEKAFMKKTSSEWIKLLKEADVVCGVLNHMKDVSRDEQAIANSFIQQYNFKNKEGESCMMPCPPIRLGSQQPPIAVSAPLPGEDTREVLIKMGYSTEYIAEMLNLGAVK
ncbi:MAG: CoA transferase [Clostridia bacterium]|nr:CoA transferase [Clostridia bacterium]